MPHQMARPSNCCNIQRKLVRRYREPQRLRHLLSSKAFSTITMADQNDLDEIVVPDVLVRCLHCHRYFPYSTYTNMYRYWRKCKECIKELWKMTQKKNKNNPSSLYQRPSWDTSTWPMDETITIWKTCWLIKAILQFIKSTLHSVSGCHCQASPLSFHLPFFLLFRTARSTAGPSNCSGTPDATSQTTTGCSNQIRTASTGAGSSPTGTPGDCQRGTATGTAHPKPSAGARWDVLQFESLSLLEYVPYKVKFRCFVWEM